jgi:hypothetical protein
MGPTLARGSQADIKPRPKAGYGAVIRSRFYPTDVVALAGPVWGLGAALTCFLIYLLTGWRR